MRYPPALLLLLSTMLFGCSSQARVVSQPSFALNDTEIGVLIYSEKLADYASEALLEELPTHASRLDIAVKDGFFGGGSLSN